MTSAATELNLSVLEELDFPTPCSVPGHGIESFCDSGPAVWIAKKTHECHQKVVPVCDKFVKTMSGIDPDELVQAPCGHVIPYREHFRVVGKL